MPDPWAWRAGACPRPHSELVTGPQSTPRPPHFPASSPFLLPLVPLLQDHQDIGNACPPWPPTPACPPVLLWVHTLMASLPQKAWVPDCPGDTGSVIQETCTRLSHPGEAYTGNSSRMLLRDSGGFVISLDGNSKEQENWGPSSFRKSECGEDEKINCKDGMC